MSRRTILCLVVLLTLTVAAAEARFTGHLDDLEAAIAARRDTLAAEPDAAKAVKQLDKALKILAKPNLDLAYAKEVKAAAKVAKILEKKLPDEAALHEGMAAALDAYRGEIDDARAVLAATATTKKLLRKLKKADRFLEKADLAATRAKELTKLAGAAKCVADLIGAGMPTEATWVVSALTIADEGLDLDDDGAPDNSLKELLAAAGQDGDALIAGLMADAQSVALIQMWDVDDWAGDSEVSAGILNGLDMDGNPKDNFSGTEAFDVTDSVDLDGRPLVRETFELMAGGGFEVTWTGQEVELGGMVLPATTKLLAHGTAALSGASGTIGVSIPVDLLLEMVVGDDPVAIALAKLAFGKYFDLDDGNAISAAFEFTAVPARTVTR